MTLVRVVRCLCVSVGTTVLSAAVLVALALGFGVSAGVANVVAVCCGIVPSYVANRRWVWNRPGHGSLAREVLPFWALSLTGLAVSTVAVARVASLTSTWATSSRGRASDREPQRVRGAVGRAVRRTRPSDLPTPRNGAMSSTVIVPPADVPWGAAPSEAVSLPKSRLHALWRGRTEDAAWVRPAVLSLLALTAVLYLWGLGASGWANDYYSAAVQAGTKSWKAFLFGSTDASNFITVDKSPASLWPMEISARIFGVNSWSILGAASAHGRCHRGRRLRDDPSLVHS